MPYALLFLFASALFAVEGDPLCRKVSTAVSHPRTFWESLNSAEPREYSGVGHVNDRLVFVERGDHCGVTYWPDASRTEHCSSGFFESSWREDRRSYSILKAFLDDGLGTTREIPRETEGIRTAVLANLRLMKALAGEDSFGTLSELRFITVVNFKTLLQLHVAEKLWRRQNGGGDVPQDVRNGFFAQTPVYRYVRELAEASGHRIRDFEIQGGTFVDVSQFTVPTLRDRAARDRAERNAALSREEKVAEDEKIFARFTVRFGLVPGG